MQHDIEAFRGSIAGAGLPIRMGDQMRALFRRTS